MPTEKIISLNNLDRYDKNLKTVAGILQRSTAYALGDVVHNKNIYLKCTTAGTTKATTLDLTNVVKDTTITDGTVVWTVTSTTGPASGESSGAGLEDWQANHSYKVDELFVYEGQIYKVLNNFTSGATFEETSDIEAYVPQELTNQQINNLINNFVPSGSGTTPIFYDDNAVGTIKAYMGITAPRDYLACDGTIYNIADYRELAEHIKTQFGSYNFFGGDGTTTFAVPDLRGEFLRGTGTNSHANQGNGSNVGEHQDSTEIANGATNGGVIELWRTNSNNLGNLIKNGDSVLNNGAGLIYGEFYSEPISKPGNSTIRPTNTSVLYCIKYKQSVLSTPENNYSTEEHVIGTWIDGKPLYQKTYIGTTIGDYNSHPIATLSNDLSVVEITGYAVTSAGSIYPVNTYFGADDNFNVYFRAVDNSIAILTSLDSRPCYITVKYIKSVE